MDLSKNNRAMTINPAMNDVTLAAISWLLVIVAFLAFVWWPKPAVKPVGPVSAPVWTNAPFGGKYHEQFASSDGSPFWVLRDQAKWQKFNAANACAWARKLHETCVTKYSKTTPTDRELAGDVLVDLPATLETVRWIEAMDDRADDRLGNTRYVEGNDNRNATPSPAVVRSGNLVFAFVRTLDDAVPQVTAALQALFRTDRQKSQIAALMSMNGALIVDENRITKYVSGKYP